MFEYHALLHFLRIFESLCVSCRVDVHRSENPPTEETRNSADHLVVVNETTTVTSE